MPSFSECMEEYRRQLARGIIQQAYKGLLEYMLELRSHFQSRHPDYFVSGNIYPGYMDMTYFSATPAALQERKLKIAVVFLHPDFRFEVWLAGYNKAVQAATWKLIRDSHWDAYHLVPSPAGVDAILDYPLVEHPDFSDLDVLTRQIEGGTLGFIHGVETFFAGLGDRP